MNLATIRSDLKARLATISGLTTYDTVPAKPEVPCAIVQPVSINVHQTFERGSSDVRFSITVLVQCADWPSAQNALDTYASIGATGSIVDALESPTTGTEDVTVETIDGYGTVQLGEGVQYGTVTFNVLTGMSA
jgi:hypothetical protein